MRGPERKNCLYMMDVIAISTWATEGKEGKEVGVMIVTAPKQHENDLGIISKLSNWNGGPIANNIM